MFSTRSPPLVDLCNNPIGTVPAICLDRDACPVRRLIFAAEILQNPAVTAVIPPGDDDAALVTALACAHRRIDRHHDPRQIRRMIPTGTIKHVERPQGAGRVLEQLGVELLPTKPRSLVLVDDLREEFRRQIRGIFVRAAARDDDPMPLAGNQRAQQFRRARRTGNDGLRALPQP